MHDMDALCTKTSLCVRSYVFLEGFFEGWFACVMAAFEGARMCNVAGSAFIRDFLVGGCGVMCVWTHQGCSMDGCLEGPDRDVMLGIQQMPCQSSHLISPGPDGHPMSCRDHHPPWTASLSTCQAVATVSLIVVTLRL